MSGRRHPASLIPICLHNPLLVQLMAGSVNLPMISYVARQYSDIIRKDGEPLASEDGPSPLISLDKFIIRLVVASNVQVSTLLTTLIYLDRLKSGLSPETRGLHRHLPCVILDIRRYSSIALYTASLVSGNTDHYCQVSQRFVAEKRGLG